jgi:hypothetical protein
MLNGCESLINASETKLKILIKRSKFQETSNPIQVAAGPEYVEKMLADKM